MSLLTWIVLARWLLILSYAMPGTGCRVLALLEDIASLRVGYGSIFWNEVEENAENN